MSDRIRAGLLECGRAGMQTPAMFALPAHVFGTLRAPGIGLGTAVLALEGKMEAPDDPRHFSAPLACNLLGVSVPFLNVQSEDWPYTAMEVSCVRTDGAPRRRLLRVAPAATWTA